MYADATRAVAWRYNIKFVGSHVGELGTGREEMKLLSGALVKCYIHFVAGVHGTLSSHAGSGDAGIYLSLLATGQ